MAVMMGRSRSLALRIRNLLIRLLIFSARELPEDREAMWSVPRPFKHAYFALLVTLCTPLLAVITAEEIASAGDGIWWMNVVAVIIEAATRFAPVGIGIAIALLIVVHIGAVFMSLYHAIANRWVRPVVERHEARGHAEGRLEGRVEGHAEGRVESNTEWRDWLNRKNEAEAQGLPFDEPPPDEKR